jgi:hypothetical protein
VELQTSKPVVITAYGLWDDEQPRMGHFVEVADPSSTDDKFRYSLDKEVDVPNVGSMVTLSIEFFKRPEARTGRDGNAFVRWAEKRRVIGLKAA